jgi:transcriptional regulator with XRE-family HTH domain
MGRPAKNSPPAYGRHLAELRRSANLTQKQLADAAKVQQSNIAFWEHSAKPPRGEVLPLLAQALGVSVETLLNIDSRSSTKAHRGPASRVEKLMAEVSKLPRRRQQKIADVLEALITQDAI